MVTPTTPTCFPPVDETIEYGENNAANSVFLLWTLLVTTFALSPFKKGASPEMPSSNSWLPRVKVSTPSEFMMDEVMFIPYFFQ